MGAHAQLELPAGGIDEATEIPKGRELVLNQIPAARRSQQAYGGPLGTGIVEQRDVLVILNDPGWGGAVAFPPSFGDTAVAIAQAYGDVAQLFGKGNLARVEDDFLRGIHLIQIRGENIVLVADIPE